MAGFGKKVRDMQAIIAAHEQRLNAFGSLLASMKNMIEQEILPDLDKTNDDVDYLFTFFGLMDEEDKPEGEDEEIDILDLFPEDDASPEDINAFILRLAGAEDEAEPVACGPEGCTA